MVISTTDRGEQRNEKTREAVVLMGGFGLYRALTITSKYGVLP